jgi:hypothetical protein
LLPQFQQELLELLGLVSNNIQQREVIILLFLLVFILFLPYVLVAAVVALVLRTPMKLVVVEEEVPLHINHRLPLILVKFLLLLLVPQVQLEMQVVMVDQAVNLILLEVEQI